MYMSHHCYLSTSLRNASTCLKVKRNREDLEVPAPRAGRRVGEPQIHQLRLQKLYHLQAQQISLSRYRALRDRYAGQQGNGKVVQQAE